MTAAKMAASAGSKPLSLEPPIPMSTEPHNTPIATRDFVWEDGSSMGMAVPGSSLDFEA